MSSENLRYLSADQALADAAQFIEWFSEARSTANSSWVAFGGSYSGVLAAWLRLKYPASVAGAVASSAPVVVQLDFYAYNQLVTRSIRRLGGQTCASLLQTGFTVLGTMVGDSATPASRAR